MEHPGFPAQFPAELEQQVEINGQHAFYRNGERWFAGKIFQTYMASRTRAMGLMRVCLQYPTSTPVMTLLAFDPNPPERRRKSCAYLYALRWLLTHRTEYEKSELLQSLLDITFSAMTLVRCFDLDILGIIGLLPSSRDEESFDRIALSTYGDTLSYLADDQGVTYGDQDRDVVRKFCTLWLRFPSPPGGIIHPALVIAHFYPLIEYTEFPGIFLEEIGEMDTYAPEIIWLMQESLTRRKDRSTLPVAQFTHLYQVVCMHFSRPALVSQARHAILGTASRLGIKVDPVILTPDIVSDTAFREMYTLVAPIYWQYRQIARDLSTILPDMARDLYALAPQMSASAQERLDALVYDLTILFAK